ncbi:hypothetical protein LJD47_30745, partial [Escherichia coli]|nr:hypothetical protein [Escherichia coli]
GIHQRDAVRPVRIALWLSNEPESPPFTVHRPHDGGNGQAVEAAVRAPDAADRASTSRPDAGRGCSAIAPTGDGCMGDEGRQAAADGTFCGSLAQVGVMARRSTSATTRSISV